MATTITVAEEDVTIEVATSGLQGGQGPTGATGATGAAGGIATVTAPITNSGTGTNANIGFDQTKLQGKAYQDLSTKANGTLTALDTGQTVSNFGNSPCTVSSGKLVHTPYGSANAAGYAQVDLASRVTHIGATVNFPLSTTGAIALVVPSASWSGGTLYDAGVHFVMTATTWSMAYWTQSTGAQTVLQSGTHSLTLGTDYDVDIYLDGSTAYISLPSGLIAKVTDSRINSNVSTYAIWELYETTSAFTSASMSKLRAGISGAVQPTNTKTVLNSIDRTISGNSFAQSLNTTMNYTVTTTQSSIGSGYFSMPVVFPASGRLKVELHTAIELSATDLLLVYPQITYSGGSTANGPSMGVAVTAGRRRASIVTMITGTPYAAVTLDWIAYKTGATSMAIYSGSSSGAGFVCATPL
jgi:hypothetical protein